MQLKMDREERKKKHEGDLISVSDGVASLSSVYLSDLFKDKAEVISQWGIFS